MPLPAPVIDNLRFNVGYVKLLVEKTPTANYAVPPATGMKPIAWQLGHIVYSVAGAAEVLGFTVALPAEFKGKYGMGSTPPGPEGYDSPADLLEKLDLATAAVVDAAQQAGDDHLAKPNPMEMLREHGLPTVADMVTFLTNGHAMLHAGEIAAARRLQGLPSVL